MADRTRISPDEEFPEDLEELKDEDVEVLNSKVTRQLDLEYVEEGGAHPETDARHRELDGELDRRGAGETGSETGGETGAGETGGETGGNGDGTN
ncbi:hypothetical protein ACX80W_12695 [Arthrobacter sp. TMN-37]